MVQAHACGHIDEATTLAKHMAERSEIEEQLKGCDGWLETLHEERCVQLQHSASDHLQEVCLLLDALASNVQRPMVTK